MESESDVEKDTSPQSVGWDDLFKNMRRAHAQGKTVCSAGSSGPIPGSGAAALVHLNSDGSSYIRIEPSKDLVLLASTSDETVQAVKTLVNALALRSCFIGQYRSPQRSPTVRRVDSFSSSSSKEPIYDPLSVPLLSACSASLEFRDGIMQVFWNSDGDRLSNALLWEPDSIPTVRKYLAALQSVMLAVQEPGAEVSETKQNKHRDFYNVRKVDTHVHHSACMHQKHLLRFIRKKYKTEGHLVVAVEGNRELTLRDLFETELGFTAHEASVDHLNVHALGSCFQRFDLFNQKYNPFGQARLRDVFLKTDNHIKGRFLAELTKEVIHDLEDRKYQHVEWRLSIYGRCPGEWERLASWVVDNRLNSPRVRWIIQVPRLYYVYRQKGLMSNFGTMLKNVFEPLFEAVKNPQRHRKIFLFLQQMVGFDSVDDESRVSKFTMEGGDLPTPEKWTSDCNPPYSYWLYYMYSNIRALNLFLEARGLRTLSFRPHCGEAGSYSHLAAAFLLADGINHAKNPVNSFFKIGLNVSLSTDDPLMFHFTDEPLLEEYSIAAHVWKLSPVDLCELARNSVLQSGFEDEFKRHWLGKDFALLGPKGNDISQTNVSNIRLQYRFDTLREELEYMREVLNIRMVLTRSGTSPEYKVTIPSPQTDSRAEADPERALSNQSTNSPSIAAPSISNVPHSALSCLGHEKPNCDDRSVVSQTCVVTRGMVPSLAAGSLCSPGASCRASGPSSISSSRCPSECSYFKKRTRGAAPRHASQNALRTRRSGNHGQEIDELNWAARNINSVELFSPESAEAM